METMKERPMLFSFPMVRAILEGRKTQTRRVAGFFTGEDAEMAAQFPPRLEGGWWKRATEGYECKCPYGVPGDRIWVRETWCLDESRKICYAADEWAECPAWNGLWRPSIFMPRAASRLSLVVDSVRVERVQSISPEDCRDEGCGTAAVPWAASGRTSDPWVDTYARLWDAINAKRGLGWDVNPWVWVINFHRLP